ncbi:NAD(P)H-binding protein [Enterococcus sp. AZ109]|uniref:NAD(P)H-binding protein n=1 Tax=Enterococcus sp. AZ109 TaxID=2774634 RepID=UPI003F21BC4C
MKVLIVGATGRVGQKLIKALADEGNQIYAGARRENEIAKEDLVIPIHFDLHWSVDEMVEHLPEVDAVYFTAGSRGKDLLQSDLYGAVKLMEAVEQKGIKRYIHLSSIFALEPAQWNKSFLAKIPDYKIAKFFSDHWLMDHSKLDYTILQPGHLDEVEAAGTIETNVVEPQSNSINDVVTVLAQLLDRPNTIGKVILMHQGDTPIGEALDKI